MSVCRSSHGVPKDRNRLAVPSASGTAAGARNLLLPCVKSIQLTQMIASTTALVRIDVLRRDASPRPSMPSAGNTLHCGNHGSRGVGALPKP